MEDKRHMFYGASPLIFERAKLLRQNMTEPEKKVWNELRANKILGLRFKPQHPIHVYIADFYCHRLKLVIEIDGDNHDQPDQSEYDEGRNVSMAQLGIKTIRFTNDDVMTKLEMVLREIKEVCQQEFNKNKSGLDLLEKNVGKMENNQESNGQTA